MQKKYELTDETLMFGGRILTRIKALKDFGDVKKGDLGGFIEREINLCHEGKCWVSKHAQVFGNAKVYGDARVLDNAKVYGDAQVFENARIFGNAKVYDDARVFSLADVWDDAMVFDNARVFDCANIFDGARICGFTQVSGETEISGSDTNARNTKTHEEEKNTNGSS